MGIWRLKAARIEDAVGARLESVNWSRAGRLASFGATSAGIILAAVYWWSLRDTYPVDLGAYYNRPPFSDLYDHPERGPWNYWNYSPVFYQVFSLLDSVSFDTIVAGYRAILLVLVVWLSGPWTVPLLLTMPVAVEVEAANINLILAAVVVIGFRWPGAWAFVLLTKPTVGVALLWFALNRRWSHVAIALGAAAVIASVSFLMVPDAWFGWLRLLTTGAGGGAVWPWNWPFWFRLPLVIGVLAYGYRRRWPLGLAATLALPVFFLTSPSMLLGAVYLARKDGRLWRPAPMTHSD